MKTRDEMLTQAANGNSDALLFLRSFAQRAHWVDDLCDRDQLPAREWYTADKFAAEETNWLLALSSNPFFLANRATLVPAMVIALSSWADSARFTPEQESVLKAQWHEVVYLVAWLTGGWNALRAACADRAFDVDLPTTADVYGFKPVNGKGENGLLRK